ncbi:MAG: hypothetical protein EBQ87_03665 [Planctomycetes bacterium]|nr:hypothetical protein [Planctomycetota bacterium]
MKNIPWVSLILPCTIIISIGCGESTPVFPTAKLEGAITIKGESVQKGNLQVISKEKVGLIAQGLITDGKFMIPDAPLGEVTILVQATKATGKMIKEYSSEYPEVINIIPNSYQQGIPFTVKKEGEPLVLDWK